MLLDLGRTIIVTIVEILREGATEVADTDTKDSKARQQEGAEKGAKASQEKLTAEERAQRLRDARAEKVRSAFEGKKYQFVEEVHLEGNQRYKDVTGNTGQHGFRLRGPDGSDETIVVGPGSLKAAVEFDAVENLPDELASKFGKEAVAASAAASDE